MPGLPVGAVINGVRKDPSSYSITINGLSIIGVSALNYSDSLEGKKIFGTAEVPIGRTRGVYECDASIEIYADEADDFDASLEALDLSRGGQGAVGEASFSIIVQIIENSQKTLTHEIGGIRVKKETNDMPSSGGNDAAVVKYDLQPLFIKRNGRTLFRRNKVPLT